MTENITFKTFKEGGTNHVLRNLCTLNECRKQWPDHVLLPGFMYVLHSIFIYLELGAVRLPMNLYGPL
jgi:hypothetical protein